MILLANQKQDEAQASCSISIEGSCAVVEMHKGEKFVFDVSKVGFKPDIAYLSYSPTKHSFFLTWSSEIAESRSGAAAVLSRNGVFHNESASASNYIAAFWVGDILAVHTMLPTFVKAADCEVKDATYTSSALDVFGNNIPQAKAFAKRVRAKQRLLRHVNELSSLAMLEAQLDLLTAYVLEKLPNDELNAVLSEVSTLTVHPREKLFETVKNQKKYLRSLQKEYFAERGDAVNSDPSV